MNMLITVNTFCLKMSNNFLKRFFVRNLEADDLLEGFWVSAIGSMLFARFYLFIFNYPQFGGRSLHIAHMLWGGLLMSLAIIFSLSFITKTAKKTSAIIGGVGFGIFIDELGKLITRDNNYFFQPAIAIIYVIFILLFFAFRKLGEIRFVSKTEYLINALEISKEVILSDLDQDEKAKALFFLKESGEKNNLTMAFTETFAQEKLVALKPNLIVKTIRKLQKFYLNIAGERWFIKSLTTFFILQSLFLITNAILIGKSFLLPSLASISLPQKLEILSSTIGAILVIAGIIKLRHNRHAAYLLFKKSLLISIFLTQVFAFYDLQLVALAGLASNIALLIALNYIISLENVFL